MTRLPLLSGVLAVLLAATPAAASGAPPATAGGPAPGAPGIDQQYLSADKSGLITSRTLTSRVWATVQKEGGLGEIFYPTIGGPSARVLQFVVADGHGHAVRANDAATVSTSLIDGRSLGFRQTFTARDGGSPRPT